MSIRLIASTVTLAATLALAVPIASAYEGGSADFGPGFATDAECDEWIDNANQAQENMRDATDYALLNSRGFDNTGVLSAIDGIEANLEWASRIGCFVIIEEGDYDPDGDTDGSSTCEDPDGSDDDGTTREPATQGSARTRTMAALTVTRVATRHRDRATGPVSATAPRAVPIPASR